MCAPRVSEHVEPIAILFLCTGNVFRSPMAQAFTAAAIVRNGNLSMRVSSAGTLDGVRTISGAALGLIDGSGIDMSSHTSRLVTTRMATDAHLIIGMTREHVRHVVALEPSAWPKAFTFKEFVRRGETVGPLASQPTFQKWLDLIGEGRERKDLLRSCPEDEVDDPIGGPEALYESTANEIKDLAERLVQLLDPKSPLAEPA